MKLTTVMGILIIGWSALTIWMHHIPLSIPPLHPVFTQSSLNPAKESSAGWLEHVPKLLGALGIMVAFGHSLLAMSGEESLAQVNREIEAPKLKNLMRAGFVIFLYSMLLTSMISFLAVAIIPDGKRVMTQIVNNGVDTALRPRRPRLGGSRLPSQARCQPPARLGLPHRSRRKARPGNADADHRRNHDRSRHQHVERDDGGYRDNLINGLVQYLAGPGWLKIIMECFVVIVGFFILAGAVNTSMIGSNGVLNRLAEDGVLTPWFQHPQPRYGTTHRLINLIGIMQLVVIVASLGNVDTLGEAYAFGVIWSFVFMTMSMAVLRFKDTSHRQYRVPFNIPMKRDDGTTVDVPLGILFVFAVLLSTALINLFTKKTATIWGIGFTAAFLIAFVIMERLSFRKHGGKHAHLEQFNEKSNDTLTLEAAGVTHANPIVVAARGPRSLPMLEKILQETDTHLRDIVVVTCKVLPPMTMGVTDHEVSITDDDRELLTRIVTVAEEVGKEVKPVVLPTNNPLYAIARAARDLKATDVVLGVSERIHAEEQLEQFALAWGTAMAEIPGVELPLTVRILGPNIEMKCTMD